MGRIPGQHRISLTCATVMIAWCYAGPEQGGRPHAAEPSTSDCLRFLPNHGNSVYEVTGLLRRWPAEGPRLLWQTQVGWGKSAVVEAGGLAFTATETDEKQWAICLDAASGEIRWKKLLLSQAESPFRLGTSHLACDRWRSRLLYSVRHSSR